MKEIFAECGIDFESKFPYFGAILNLKYCRGKNTQSLVNSAKSNLYKVLRASIPNECSECIFKYFYNHELGKFAEEKFL